MKDVKFLGLAQSVEVGGPGGSEETVAQPGQGIACFLIDGWEEAAGHKLLRQLECAGDALADGVIDFDEIFSILQVSDPSWLNQHDAVKIAVKILPGVLKRIPGITKDGKVEPGELAKLAGSIALEVIDCGLLPKLKGILGL